MSKIGILLLTLVYFAVFSCYGPHSTRFRTPESTDTDTDTATGTVQAKTVATEKISSKETVRTYTKKETWFRLPSYKGGEIDLAAYAGKPVLLMFFTEGCPYCRKAAPFIAEMGDKYSGKGLSVIGIALERSPAPVARFAKDFGLGFPLAYNGQAAAAKYNAMGVPFIYLLTKAHSIHNVWAGYDPGFDPEIIRAVEEVIR